jgi:hypothetical protein
LLEAEAKSLNIAASDLMAREITDKMREFSDEERYNLQNALKNAPFRQIQSCFRSKNRADCAEHFNRRRPGARQSDRAGNNRDVFGFSMSGVRGDASGVEKGFSGIRGQSSFRRARFSADEHSRKRFFKPRVAANAANAQGKFFEYAEILYKNQNALDAASLKKYAADLGLNVKQFELDLSDAQIADEVRKDMEDGKKYGIGGTPTVFVNGVKVRVMSESGFREAIEKALKK